MRIQQPLPTSVIPTRRARAGRGFTIVEVLIAMGILAIGIASVYTLLPVAALLQKQAIDAAQGPEFAASVLAQVKTLNKLDACFGSGAVQDYFDEIIYSPGPGPRFNLNGQSGRNYNYRLLYRRLQANGPVEVAVMVYRKLPGEEVPTTPITTQAQAVRLDQPVANVTTDPAVWGVRTNATSGSLVTTSNVGLVLGTSLNGNVPPAGSQFLIGNPGGAYYVTTYIGTATGAADPDYTYRVSPSPPINCSDLIVLRKNSSTITGTLSCIAIATGVIE